MQRKPSTSCPNLSPLACASPSRGLHLGPPASRLWHHKSQSHPSGTPCKSQNFTMTPRRCQAHQRECLVRGENSREPTSWEKAEMGETETRTRGAVLTAKRKDVKTRRTGPSPQSASDYLYILPLWTHPLAVPCSCFTLNTCLQGFYLQIEWHKCY